MNNPQGNIDQMSQLQNIAYVKQFMQKGSVKVMMVIAFIQAILSAVLSFKIAGVLKAFLQMISEGMMGLPDIDESTMQALNAVSGVVTIIGLIATAITLMVPVALLMITLKANSDDPTVVSRGSVSFLKVLAIIQLIFAILAGILTLIGNVSALKESGGKALGNLIGSVVGIIIECMYYYSQVKFLSSIRTACDGITMSSEGAQGVGVYNVLFAIINGLVLIGLIIMMVIVTSFAKSEQISSNEFTEFLSGAGLSLFNFVMVVMMIYVVLSMIFNIAYAMTAFGYRDMIVSTVREAYASAQTRHTSNQKLMRTYGGGTMYNTYNYSNSGTGTQEGGQNRGDMSSDTVNEPQPQMTAPVSPSVQPQQPQQSHIDLEKPPVNTPQSNPYAGSGSFNSGANPNPYTNNAENGSFNANPYTNNAGNGSFNANPYMNNSGNGSFNPDPYMNNAENSSFNANPYMNGAGNSSSNGGSPFDYQPTPNNGNSPFDYQPDQNGGNSPFDYQPDQNGGNSPFDYHPDQNSGNSPFDYQPDQNSGNSPFDYQPDQNSGNSPFDYHPDQNGGNSPFDYYSDQNSGNSPFDYHPDQNGGNSPFDYHPDQNGGNSPFDYHPDQNSGNSPFDYHPDQNSGNSPFDYNPNQNPYGNGGNS